MFPEVDNAVLPAQDPIAPDPIQLKARLISEVREGDLPVSPSQEMIDETLTTTGRRCISTSDSALAEEPAKVAATEDFQALGTEPPQAEEEAALAADKSEELPTDVASSAAQFFEAVDCPEAIKCVWRSMRCECATSTSTVRCCARNRVASTSYDPTLRRSCIPL